MARPGNRPPLGSERQLRNRPPRTARDDALLAQQAQAQLQIRTASDASVLVEANEIGTSVQAYDDRLESYASGELTVGVVNATADHTVIAGQAVILCDATAGNMSVFLPAAAGALGRRLTIKKTDAGANTVTADPAGSETIDGAATYVLTTQYETIRLVCDGTGWNLE